MLTFTIAKPKAPGLNPERKDYESEAAWCSAYVDFADAMAMYSAEMIAWLLTNPLGLHKNLLRKEIFYWGNRLVDWEKQGETWREELMYWAYEEQHDLSKEVM